MSKHVEQLKKLRALGVAPVGYSTRSLSPQQKSAITRLARKYHDELKHPGEFKSISISRSQADKFRAQNATVRKVGNKFKVTLPTHGAKNVTIKNGEVVRTWANRSTRDIPTSNLLLDAKKFFKDKKPGDFVMLRTGHGEIMARRIYSEKDLLKYIDSFERDHGLNILELEPRLYTIRMKK